MHFLVPIEDPVISDLAMLEKLMSDENAPEEFDPSPLTASSVQVDVPSDVKKARLKAKVSQAQRIKCKRQKCNTKPVMGKLMKEKSIGPRMSMKDIAGETGRPRQYSDRQVILTKIAFNSKVKEHTFIPTYQLETHCTMANTAVPEFAVSDLFVQFKEVQHSLTRLMRNQFQL